MNMPEVDEYGTVSPHTIIRQHMDYGHWVQTTFFLNFMQKTIFSHFPTVRS